MKTISTALLSVAASSHVVAQNQSTETFDYLSFVHDTFHVTVSQSDFLGDYSSDYVFTLHGSHNLNSEWRVFGSVDTDGFADIGVGYSFLLFDSIYNEWSTSVGSDFDNVDVYTTGVFSAYAGEKWVLFTNLDVQYVDSDANQFEDLVPWLSGFVTRHETIELKKLIGVNYELTDWLSVTTMYGHDSKHYRKLSFVNGGYMHLGTTHSDYINAGFTLNLWGVKPTISHQFDLENSGYNYWDFSLSFDF